MRNQTNSNNSFFSGQTPKELGFHFPAEFEKQDALWLSWPHKEESWPGKLHLIYNSYAEFILQVAVVTDE